MPEIQMPSVEICDRARASRDARFDGLFFIAVRSTGIFCRPVCPAPTAKRQNVTYYPTAAAAAAAGYRPCLRCRPELSPELRVHGNEDAMHRALALIADGALEEGSIEALASKVDLSARQLRRLFLANTGATPVAVHATRRLLLAKQLLTETTMPVTQIAFAAGFKSLRRFNAAFREGYGMAPTAVRRTAVQLLSKQPAWNPGDALTLRLAYRPPLAFTTMLQFFARQAIPGLEVVTSNSFRRYIGPAESPAQICVTAAEEKPELRLEISGVDARSIPEVVRRVRRLFDLEADMQAAHSVLREDPLMADSIRRQPGLRVPGVWDGFEVSIRAVLEQDETPEKVASLLSRIVDHCGEKRENAIEGLDRVFPAPSRFLESSLERIGISKSMERMMRGVATAIVSGQLEFRAGQLLNDFIERFIAIPGVSKSAAHSVAMRALNHPDAFPVNDRVVKNVFHANRPMTESEIDLRSQAWRPWRAYAVLHLWHSI